MRWDRTGWYHSNDHKHPFIYQQSVEAHENSVVWVKLFCLGCGIVEKFDTGPMEEPQKRIVRAKMAHFMDVHERDCRYRLLRLPIGEDWP